MTEPESNESPPGWAALLPEHDAAAARILADCAALASVEGAATALAALRNDPEGELLGWVDNGQVIAVYGLRRGALNYDLLWLAVDPVWRGQRYGRSALVDALRRVGRKPLTVEADEATKGWFQQLGFRIVGRRPLSEGGARYRLGWYAPRRPGEPGHGAHG
ncbi:MAG: GNAT family N-acetyltransferase [Thermomicrobiales bacterium]